LENGNGVGVGDEVLMVCEQDRFVIRVIECSPSSRKTVSYLLYMTPYVEVSCVLGMGMRIELRIKYEKGGLE